jgi:hypothetical protein
MQIPVIIKDRCTSYVQKSTLSALNILAIILTITDSAPARPFGVISISRNPICRFFHIAHLNILGTSCGLCKQDWSKQRLTALIISGLSFSTANEPGRRRRWCKDAKRTWGVKRTWPGTTCTVKVVRAARRPFVSNVKRRWINNRDRLVEYERIRCPYVGSTGFIQSEVQFIAQEV